MSETPKTPFRLTEPTYLSVDDENLRMVLDDDTAELLRSLRKGGSSLAAMQITLNQAVDTIEVLSQQAATKSIMFNRLQETMAHDHDHDYELPMPSILSALDEAIANLGEMERTGQVDEVYLAQFNQINLKAMSEKYMTLVDLVKFVTEALVIKPEVEVTATPTKQEAQEVIEEVKQTGEEVQLNTGDVTLKVSPIYGDFERKATVLVCKDLKQMLNDLSETGKLVSTEPKLTLLSGGFTNVYRALTKNSSFIDFFTHFKLTQSDSGMSHAFLDKVFSLGLEHVFKEVNKYYETNLQQLKEHPETANDKVFIKLVEVMVEYVLRSLLDEITCNEILEVIRIELSKA